MTNFTYTVNKLLEEIDSISSSIDTSINKIDEAEDESKIKEGVLNGTIPSGVKNSGVTSTCGKPGDPFIVKKIFQHANRKSNSSR